MPVFYTLKNNGKKLRLPLIIFFALISFLATSCAAKKSRIIKHSFKKGKNAVIIVEKEVDDLYFSRKKLEHPRLFTPEQIIDNLKSLKYKRLTLFSKKENVFDEKIAKEISPLLINAFKKSSAKDYIEIDVHAPEGRTIGDVFIFRKKLNWRFKIINGASFERRNSKDYLDGWKLVLQKNQKYHGEKELFGVRTAKNWIVYPVDKNGADLALPDKDSLKVETDNEFNSKSEKDIVETFGKKQPNKDTPKKQKEIEAQFRRLKSLMEKGLITGEEYKTKKQEMLEKYF
mgnify:FL=1